MDKEKEGLSTSAQDAIANAAKANGGEETRS
jgi:hypothetical protein